ncbi:hypothetical protein Ddye_023300 [Dipteronia dyeriana]|uniref:HAT C-terminal dimerisation domain-containing protein n=1 Tax=Dipteronia dyeriana TaxID=168575 RepID=A0AAD9WT75_9ROSI|nr:hypothetical protein Ddye_023300 [Dipteronia dyeriana]
MNGARLFPRENRGNSLAVKTLRTPSSIPSPAGRLNKKVDEVRLEEPVWMHQQPHTCAVIAKARPTGKGRMSEPDPIQPDNIGFDDTAYHEFLQRQAYLESLNYPVNPNPPLIISEPNSSQPTSGPSPGNMTSQSENISDFATDPIFEDAIEKDKKQIKRLRGSSSSSSSSSSVSYDEIETYHTTNFEFIGDDGVNNFDILHWWREHQKHLPILSIIAKQILATPVSTMAVEQEFLSPESIQVQVCVDDWTNAEYRQQEMESDVIYDFFDDDHTTGTGTEDID